MRWLGLGSLVLLAACAPSEASAPARTDDGLTSIEPTEAIQQTIPNCWDFATTGWIESMAKGVEGGADVDLSEAYVDYVAWLIQLWQPSFEALRKSGYWGTAVELLHRYGWMSEADFLGLDGAVPDFAIRHQQALTLIKKEIASGDLRTPEMRADAANVVTVLNRVWQVPPKVAADLARTFGDGMEKTLQSRGVDLAGTRIHRLDEIKVGYGPRGKELTAADVVGTLAPDTRMSAGQRVGPYAFSMVDEMPTDDADMAALLARVQRTLAGGLPVPMAVMQDDSVNDASGTYRKPTSGKLADAAYAHLVTVFDSSVDAPGFGLLPAGIPETRPEALAASYAEGAKVLSLRARNTYWGSYQRGATIPFAGSRGTNDYATEYLTMMTRNPSTGAARRVVGAFMLPNEPDVSISKTRR